MGFQPEFISCKFKSTLKCHDIHVCYLVLGNTAVSGLVVTCFDNHT